MNPMLFFSATKGSSLKEEWIAYIAREILRVRPIKKLSLFLVTGLNILGRVGTHIIFLIIFFWKKYNYMHFERHFAFQNE